MTPPSTHAGRAVRRSPAPRAPRRTSGPARPRRTPATIAAARGGAFAVPTPFGLRIARRAVRVGDARLLDRLVRGRAWIAIVAVGLLGIVFMQVSMLRLNAGISRAVTASETLQRQNSTLRADIAELDSAQRIQDTAAGLGMVMPEAGKVHYLDARAADGLAAARGVRAPSEEAAATIAAAAAAMTGPALGAQGAASAPAQPGAAPRQSGAATAQAQLAGAGTAAEAGAGTSPAAGAGTSPAAGTSTSAGAGTSTAAATSPAPDPSTAAGPSTAPAPGTSSAPTTTEPTAESTTTTSTTPAAQATAPVPEGGAAAPQGG